MQLKEKDTVQDIKTLLQSAVSYIIPTLFFACPPNRIVDDIEQGQQVADGTGYLTN